MLERSQESGYVAQLYGTVDRSRHKSRSARAPTNKKLSADTLHLGKDRNQSFEDR